MQLQTRIYLGCKYLTLVAGLSFMLAGCGGSDGSGAGASATKVLYLASQDNAKVFELYRSDNGARLNPLLVSGGTIIQFALTPDNKSIVYTADQDKDERLELYRLDLANPGVSIKLNATMVPGGDVGRFDISPDGSKVVYDADADIPDVSEVYLVNLDGTNHHKINGSVGNPPVVSVIIKGTSWSPDGRFIVQRVLSGGTVGLNVYDTSLGVQNSTRLTPPWNSFSFFRFTPDSTSVVYLADQGTGKQELYRVAFATPGVSIRLNAPLAVNRAVGFFDVIADGTGVVYLADQDRDNVFELYRVAFATPGTSTKLNAALVAGGNVFTFDIMPDSTAVVYHADQDRDNVFELYRVSFATPGVSTKLNATLVPGGNVVSDFRITPDSTAVVYRADQDTDGVEELYRVSFATLGVSTKLNATLVPGGIVFDFRITPDSTGVVYRADQDRDNVGELYRVVFATPGVNTKLNGLLVPGGRIDNFVVLE